MTRVFDLSERTKLRFSGPQALWFLDQLVSNKVDQLQPGTGSDALLLTPKGRITSVMRLLCREEETLVDAESGQAEFYLDFFGMRVFATKVSFSDVTGDFSILRVLGPQATELVTAGLEAGDPGQGEHQNAAFGHSQPGGTGNLLARVTRPAEGIDIWVKSADKAQVVEQLAAAGAHPGTEQDYEALRVAGGLPLHGRDFDESFLPQEAAMERAVHYQKGCYLGQEAVAMAQRGRIKRRLRHLEFRASGCTGRVMSKDGKEAGKVTSAASSEGRWFGIGVVKTEVPVGDEVQVIPEEGDPAAARVSELPGTTYGPRVPSARELREKLQRG